MEPQGDPVNLTARLARALHLRLAPRDVERLEQVSEGTPFRRATVAREALRLGLERIEREGAEVLVRRQRRGRRGW